MNNKMDFPRREAIDDEAIAWLIKLDGDKPLNQNEERDLEEWLSRSPAHREALKSVNMFWSHCNVLGELAEPQSVTTVFKQKVVNYCRSAWGVGLATAIALVIMIGVINPFDTQTITNSNGLYVTTVGQQKTISLIDGSNIQLNTNSEIQVDYTDAFRNIRLLRGEVHFTVAKDANRPFRVYAQDGRVEALGTAFNVYLHEGNLDLFVTEGRVEVASSLSLANAKGEGNKVSNKVKNNIEPKSKLTPKYTNQRDDYTEDSINGLGVVSAGERVILKKITSLPTSLNEQASDAYVELTSIDSSTHENENKRLAWRRGLLVFSGESLAEVVAEINRYIPVTIEVLDPALRNIEIGGQIQVGDTTSMFNALEANFGLRVKHLSYNQVQLVAAKEKS